MRQLDNSAHSLPMCNASTPSGLIRVIGSSGNGNQWQNQNKIKQNKELKKSWSSVVIFYWQMKPARLHELVEGHSVLAAFAGHRQISSEKQPCQYLF